MLTLALPAALWGLLALPVIVLLRVVARRPRVVVVPSLIPWRGAANAAPDSRRRRLLLDAGLLLQLAAAAAVVLGAAGLDLGGGAAAPRVAVVLDDSASMAAGRRMEEARDRLRAELLAAGEPVGSLWVSSPFPRRLAGPDASRAELLAALDGVRAAAAPGDLAGAAGAAARELAGAGTFLAASDDLRPLRDASAPGLVLLRVGEPVRNLGIIDAAIESGRAFCSVLNAGSQAESVTVEFAVGNAVSRQQAEIPAGARRGFTFDLPADAKGSLRFHVSGTEPDALAADDSAWLSAAPEPVPAVLAAPGRSAWRTARALAAMGFPEARPAAPGETARLTLAVGLWPPEPPADGFCVILDPPEGELAGVRVGGEPAAARVRAEGELFPHAGGFEFTIPAARTVDPGPGGTAVLAADDGRTVAALSADRRVCVLAFDPEATDWVKHPSFPVFFERLAAVCPPLAAMRRDAWLTGEACPPGLPGPVRAPGGATVPPGEPLVEVGLYTCNGVPAFAANLLSPAETACPVAGEELRRSAPQDQAAATADRRWPLAPWLFAAALLLLAAEWAVARRG